jgi:hypothetical protein
MPHISPLLRDVGSTAPAVRLFHVSQKRRDLGHPPGRTITLNSCYTILVSSKSQLRNVTVTLEEDVAQWARIEAARRDTSVSRLLGELLKERMTAQDDYARAMRRALGRKPFLRSTGRYLTREEAHDRSRLR